MARKYSVLTFLEFPSKHCTCVPYPLQLLKRSLQGSSRTYRRDIIAFRDCPSLRRIVSWADTTYTVAFYPNVFQVMVPWSQIEGVSVTHSSFVAEELFGCKALRSADLDLEQAFPDGRFYSEVFGGYIATLSPVTRQAHFSLENAKLKLLAVQTRELQLYLVFIGGVASSQRHLKFRNTFLDIDFPNLQSFWLEHSRSGDTIDGVCPNTLDWMAACLSNVKVWGLRLCPISASAVYKILSAAPGRLLWW
ncbi:hypothetical protein DFP72DRAFT_313573 [Ephemerocybe angulata]|uniref:Uncharacterized protein n=1 Tax=Ephemerocybe angulata TaxID=980116 RepID=A0A8H6I1I7_9AGAR|nr:hypothetical protein DFP72DRAFT_313573 [Tulosesus angulatus]